MYPNQQEAYRRQFLPEVDHRLAVWQAYLNCLNAFQGIDMMSGSEHGESLNISAVAVDRFCYYLVILDGMIDDDKDSDFYKKGPEDRDDPPRSAVDIAEKNPPPSLATTATGKIRDIIPYLRYWYRVDRLMRRQGMFTSVKTPTGRI